jgi:sec-independent protein translocase protein TatA
MISGWEWIVIIVALVVILLWGPGKIPELARGLGRAKAEFERASREGYASEVSRDREYNRTSDDDMIILIAKGLGITTEGKTKNEIFQEIINSIKALKSSSTN